MTSSLLKRAIRKGKKVPLKYRIVAVGFNKKGEFLSVATNRARFSKKSGGLHAEINMLLRHGKDLHSLFLLRVSRKGELLPIDSCACCKGVLAEHKVRVYKVRRTL